MKPNLETKPIAMPLALIIEDNEDQNLVFTTALEQAGYYTESIRNRKCTTRVLCGKGQSLYGSEKA